MRQSTTYSFWLAAAAVAVLTLGGCSSDITEEDRGQWEGVPTDVAFSISARRNAETRADGSPATPLVSGEKICDWFVVFVDKTNTVRKILHRSDVETQIAQNTSPVEEERFKCILPSGTYSIYAFANMSEDDLTEGAGLTFEVGNKVDPAVLASKAWTRNLNLLDIDEGMPMSGCLKDVKIENTIEETFAIEVVRMAAKVELIFTNPDDKAVNVNSVGIDPVTTSDISLFPCSTIENKTGISYSHLGNSAYTPLDGATYGKVTYKPAYPITVTKSEPKNTVFYIQESISDYDNEGSFTITLNVKHEDGTAETEQHNITRDIRGYINRNDWIRIPISLSRYDVSVEALFYPPIGGYPAVLSDKDPEGAQVFTFGTEGDFAIVPHVTDKLTDTHLSPLLYSVSLTMKERSDSDVESDSEIDIAGDAEIFKRKPTTSTVSNALPDEIIGELSAKEGTARLNLSVKIYNKPKTQSDAKVINTYTRPVYIVRKNLSTNNTD